MINGDFVVIVVVSAECFSAIGHNNFLFIFFQFFELLQFLLCVIIAIDSCCFDLFLFRYCFNLIPCLKSFLFLFLFRLKLTSVINIHGVCVFFNADSFSLCFSFFFSLTFTARFCAIGTDNSDESTPNRNE